MGVVNFEFMKLFHQNTFSIEHFLPQNKPAIQYTTTLYSSDIQVVCSTVNLLLAVLKVSYAKLRLILILMQENKLVFLSLFLLEATYVGQANRQLPDINSWPHISKSVVVQQQGRHIHSYTNTYC